MPETSTISFRKKFLSLSLLVINMNIVHRKIFKSPASKVFRTLCIDPFDTQIDVHLFLPAETKIGWDKPRDLFRPIAVTVCNKKWRSNYTSEASIFLCYMIKHTHLSGQYTPSFRFSRRIGVYFMETFFTNIIVGYICLIDILIRFLDGDDCL